MEVIIGGFGLFCALIVGGLIMWSVNRAKTQRAGQERDWEPLKEEFQAQLEKPPGTFTHYALAGTAHGATFEATISHLVAVDRKMTRHLSHNNTYRTQIYAVCTGDGPSFVLTPVREGKGKASHGDDAFRSRYKLGSTDGELDQALSATVQEQLVAGHELFLKNRVVFVTGGKAVTALFGNAATDTDLCRAAIEVCTAIAGAPTAQAAA